MQLCQYPDQSRIRRFTLEAIQIPIVYNQYGDYDPNGLLYVLEQDSQRIQEEALRRFRQTPPQPYEEVQPLVLRVNLGDSVKICFRNRLGRRLSIHVQGLLYDVAASDGTSTGFNQDSTTDNEIEYTWYADTEGVFLFHDMADPRSSEEATNIHGLFGAVIVEPPGARWFHPETGEEMESGLMADIYQPGKTAFREYTVFFHDELEILDKDGILPVDHRTGLPSSTTAISYRSEPMRNRMPLTHDPADSGEDISMSSWVYGDPAPSILRAYVGDPAKIRLVHGGIKETHVFYLHNHQWRLEADLLPEYLEATPFQLRTRTDIVGHHVHLVKFDTITSDGAANGWNNIAGARKYETLVERFFADEELRTVFFHDHLFANAHQFHGVFGALVIEEAGRVFTIYAAEKNCGPARKQ